MTHPYEEMKEMKKLKKHYDMLGFVWDTQYGIPTRSPCGGEIMTNVYPTPKYKSDFDALPGSRYFTCKNYEVISAYLCLRCKTVLYSRCNCVILWISLGETVLYSGYLWVKLSYPMGETVLW